MTFSSVFKRLLLLLLLPVGVWAAPVIVGLPVDDSTSAVKNHVEPNIPVGKALILPISVYDDSADVPTIRVAVTNGKGASVFARVRTGDPTVVMHVVHGSSGSTDLPYSGDITYLLFNDWAPKTAAFLEGFAQSGFYDQRQIFRIADLNGTGTGGPQFIFQGGSPNNTNTGTLASTGVAADPDGAGPHFSFNNEFSAPVIFAGRGQLAMANAGFNISGSLQVGDYAGTNGSQFFITDAPTRFLDFVHTIFGQITHAADTTNTTPNNWALLDDLSKTPFFTTDDPDPAGVLAANTPKSPVTVTSTRIVPHYNDGQHTYTDAVLVLSAKAPGTAKITVTVGTTVSTFTATAFKDTANDPPFFQQLDPTQTKESFSVQSFKVVDLEYDFVNVTALNGSNFSTFLLNNFVNGISNKGEELLNSDARLFEVVSVSSSNGTSTGLFKGALLPVFQLEQVDVGGDSSLNLNPRDPTDYLAPTVSVGIKPVTPDPLVVRTTAGTQFTAVVGRLTSTDAHALPASFVASVNWGDGFSENTKNSFPGPNDSSGHPTTVTVPSSTGTVDYATGVAGSSTFQVSGTYTYAKAGIYPVVIDVTAPDLGVSQIRSTVVVTDNATAPAISVAPVPAITTSAVLTNHQVATFVDPTTPGLAASYAATIDWGDGVISKGTVRASASGVFTVYGSHRFADPESFSILVHVHKTGSPADLDGMAWGHVKATGFTATQHLPPFNQAHLSGRFTVAPTNRTQLDENPTETGFAAKSPKVIVGSITGKSQTYLTGALNIRNTGNLASKPGTLRLLLSKDQVPSADDIPLKFGPSRLPTPQTLVAVPTISPGHHITYYFDIDNGIDFRIVGPPNNTMTGYYVVADLQYGDPMVAVEPIEYPTLPRVQGVIVSPQKLSTTETGGSGTFTVNLDRQPAANVTIALAGDTTEGVISPASLTFTPANWFTPQVVQVTGIPDPTASIDRANTPYTVTLGPAVSTDKTFDGLAIPSVTVTNADRDADILVTTSAISTTGASQPIPISTSSAVTPATSGTVTLTLSKRPTQPVTIQIINGNTADGTLLPLSGDPYSTSLSDANPFITITPEGWDAHHATQFLIRGKTDTTLTPTATGATTTVTYTLSFAVTAGGNASDPTPDPDYDGIVPAPVTVTNTTPTPLITQ